MGSKIVEKGKGKNVYCRWDENGPEKLIIIKKILIESHGGNF